MNNPITLTLPTDWDQLTADQYRYACKLLSSGLYTEDEIQTLCFVRFTRIRPVSAVSQSVRLFTIKNGMFRKKRLFTCDDHTITHFRRALAYLTQPPVGIHPYPVRSMSPLHHQLLQVPFSQYLAAEANYQQYIDTGDDAALCRLCAVLYTSEEFNDTNTEKKAKKFRHLSPVDKFSIFHWYTSVKTLFHFEFPNLFKPADPSDHTTDTNTIDIINSQLHLLTGGDITKEAPVLASDIWRALTMLDQKIKEYEQFKKIKNNV